MRLVKIGQDGSLTVTKDFIDNIPQYAILSHRWLSDDEELTFADTATGSGRHKQGYAKLQFCAEQSRRDSLEYFWVDTCCIDKSNHSELSEAIVSMFSWYREAVKCYVYLTGVSVDKIGDIATSWHISFRRSEWFTRGWTLQELLAPKWVEFFSEQGLMLGDRNSLEPLISEITQIPVRALRGRPLTDYSIKDRFAWAQDRKTRREEDKVYCLQGIFNIVMIPQYGEGYNRATRRLYREIQKSSENDVPWVTGLRVHEKSSAISGHVSVNEADVSKPDDGDEESIKKLQLALTKAQEENAPNHHRVLAAREDLATALKEIGDHEKAADEFRRALIGRELRKQQAEARTDLIQLACCLSALNKDDKVSPAVARRVSDHYIYTRPVGVCGAKDDYYAEIADLGVRVTVLRVWFHEDRIEGIQLDYSDGSRSPPRGYMRGQPDAYVLHPGDTISDITMWLNANATGYQLVEVEMLNYNEIGQALRTQFSLGSRMQGSSSYRRPETGTGVLVGVHGRVGPVGSTYSLGFVFFSPTHALARRSVFDITRLEDRSKRYYDLDTSHLPNLYITSGIGGPEGEPFQVGGSSRVRKLFAWSPARYIISGIQLEFDNGTRSVVRGEAEGKTATFEFHEGEYMTKLEMSIANHVRGVGAFWFETNENRSFETRNDERPEWCVTERLKPGGILVGMYGYCGKGRGGIEIMWLGFMFR